MPRPGSRPPSDLRARGLTVKLGPPVTSPQSRPLEPQLPASRPGPEGAPDSKTAAPGPSAGGGLDSALRGPRNRAAPPRSGPVRSDASLAVDLTSSGPLDYICCLTVIKPDSSFSRM
ncbi:uncharacterized protein LOC118146261 isoform X2 [Callithrix jacchus]|uniref:translation initiation factor IF-2-like isoform X2 n=1 Tax=Callithrix jacchus TaxID=9483 RepID=UPI00159E02D5|nr:translation initiation factor IF-2-like isoform X2 [Callithrix jacchus]XP_035123569.1 translation initiation factor IF-2-like isoform X2 [Callithrix jacchus]